MSHIPYFDEDHAIVVRDGTTPPSVLDFEYDASGLSWDILDQEDTLSLEDLEDIPQTEMERAGIDDLTPADTFLNMNGDSRFITEI